MVKFDNLKVCHLNVRSLTSHFDDLQEFFETNIYDLIAISETWLTTHIETNRINLHGFNFVRRDRRGGGRGGGVGIYISNRIKYNILPYSLDLEDVWVSFKVDNVSVVFGCVYKAPSINNSFFLNELENSLFNLCANYDEIICVGDFNIDFLNVNNLSVLSFNNILDSFGLRQVVNFPTRITSHSLTLLDLVLVSENRGVCKCGSISLENISDHELVYVHLNFKTEGAQAMSREYRDYKNIDPNILNGHLQAIPWRNLYDLNSADEKVSFLNENLNILLNIHAPLKQSQNNKKPKPWITENIKIIIKQKNKALTKYKRLKTEQSFVNYKNIKNFLTSAIRMEKKAYIRHSMGENNPKKLWADLRKLNVK